MNGFSIVYWIKSFLKGVLVAIFALIGMAIGHYLVPQSGLEVHEWIFPLKNENSIVVFFIITIVTAILVGELFKFLKQPPLERLLSIFVYHFFFFYILRAFDDFLYSREFIFTYDFICHLGSSILFSLLVSILFKPSGETVSLFTKFQEYFSRKKPINYTIRFTIGGLCFVPIYFLANWFIAPFVEPFYVDVNAQSTVTYLKNVYINISLKILIGFLFVIVLMPIFVLWPKSKTSLLFWLGFPSFVIGAVYPTVVELWLPLGLRFPYLIQYTVVIYLIAIIFVQLFYLPKESEIIDDQFKWMY